MNHNNIITCPKCNTKRFIGLKACRNCGSAASDSAAEQCAPAPTNKGSLTVDVKQKQAKGPNKTEAEYRRLYLDPQWRAGEISQPLFEKITLRLGIDCRYTPDWSYWTDGHLHMVEVKGGHVWDDAKAKFRAAVEQFPNVRFTWAQKRSGKWNIQEFTTNKETA
jgi:hypothetical protein